jgi:nucleotide-binding universal stress UspA family protein
MEIKKLLFVTKFEELRFDALQSLLDLRKADLDHVVFVNVIERDQVAMRRGTGYQKTEELKLREKANIRFIDWAENLFEQGMEVGVYIVVGNFVQQVVSAWEKEGADIIVMGPPKKGMLEQLYSGSDITEIIRRTATPVLVYKDLSQEGRKHGLPFERPLFATNWSSADQGAAEFLKGLNKVVQEVNVINVVDEKDLKGNSVTEVQKARKKSRKKLENICDIFESEGIDANPHVYVGDTVSEIENAAHECRASMIIVGTSGKGRWRERWIGSTPQTVAEKSDFPTLVIPDPS